MARANTGKNNSENARPESKSRSIAAGADAGLVPVASSAKDGAADSNAVAGGTSAIAPPVTANSPAPKPVSQPLSPQARENQATQKQLEAALADSLPKENASASRGLIVSLKPSASGRALTVILSDGWYQLGPEQQDAIASALWNQRSSLKLQQLELQDPKGRTLARPPVIGNQIVILRR